MEWDLPASGMNIYSYPYRSKYRFIINLSYVADTVWTHMASSMNLVTVNFLYSLFPGCYQFKKPNKQHIAKIIMVGQKVPMPCLNSCLEISMARGGLQSFLLSNPLLALRFQSYQYDKGKTFLLSGGISRRASAHVKSTYTS